MNIVNAQTPTSIKPITILFNCIFLHIFKSFINVFHFLGALSVIPCAEIFEKFEIVIEVHYPIALFRASYNNKFVNQRALSISRVSVMMKLFIIAQPVLQRKFTGQFIMQPMHPQPARRAYSLLII